MVAGREKRACALIIRHGEEFVALHELYYRLRLRLSSSQSMHLEYFVDSRETEWSKLRGCATDHSKTIPIQRCIRDGLLNKCDKSDFD